MNPIENLKDLIIYQSQNNENISVEVLYDIEFSKSNHGMYNDLNKMQIFIDKSLEYCNKYFK